MGPRHPLPAQAGRISRWSRVSGSDRSGAGAPAVRCGATNRMAAARTCRTALVVRARPAIHSGSGNRIVHCGCQSTGPPSATRTSDRGHHRAALRPGRHHRDRAIVAISAADARGRGTGVGDLHRRACLDRAENAAGQGSALVARLWSTPTASCLRCLSPKGPPNNQPGRSGSLPPSNVSSMWTITRCFRWRTARAPSASTSPFCASNLPGRTIHDDGDGEPRPTVAGHRRAASRRRSRVRARSARGRAGPLQRRHHRGARVGTGGSCRVQSRTRRIRFGENLLCQVAR